MATRRDGGAGSSEHLRTRVDELRDNITNDESKLEVLLAQLEALVEGHNAATTQARTRMGVRMAGSESGAGTVMTGRGKVVIQGDEGHDDSGADYSLLMAPTARRMYGAHSPSMMDRSTNAAMGRSSTTGRHDNSSSVTISGANTDKKKRLRAAHRIQQRSREHTQYQQGGWERIVETILTVALEVNDRLRKAQEAGTLTDERAIQQHQRFQLGVTKEAAILLSNSTRESEGHIEQIMRRGGTTGFNAPRAGPARRGGQRRVPGGGSGNRGKSIGAAYAPRRPDNNDERTLRLNKVYADMEAGEHAHGGIKCDEQGCWTGHDLVEYVEANVRRCFTCGCKAHHHHRDNCPYDMHPNDAQPTRKRLAADGTDAMCYKCGEVGKKGEIHLAQDCKNPASCMEKNLNPEYPCDGKHATRDCPERRQSGYNSSLAPQRSSQNDRGGDGGRGNREGRNGGGGAKGGRGSGGERGPRP